MGRKEKRIDRFRSIPNDFRWDDLCSMLKGFGYEIVEGSGSRRKFYNRATGKIINLHEPHPKPVVQQYALRQVLAHLKETGDLK